MMPRFELRHLRSFIAVADELHFGRAAERLYVTQPALTQNIHQFEDLLGIQLFVRTTRAVALTSEGARLLPHVRNAMSSVDRVGLETDKLRREQMGRLVVGCQIGTALMLIPEVVREFEANYPQYSIIFREYDFTQPASGLDIAQTDIAFLRPPLGHEDIDVLTLYQERRLVGVPLGHSFAARESVSISDVLLEPIIGAPTPGIWRDYWLLNEYRSEPANVVFEAPTFESELQAVAAGRGVIVTCEATRKYFTRPNVSFVDIDNLPPCDVAIAWPRGYTHPAIQPFVSIVARMASEMEP